MTIKERCNQECDNAVQSLKYKYETYEIIISEIDKVFPIQVDQFQPRIYNDLCMFHTCDDEYRFVVSYKEGGDGYEMTISKNKKLIAFVCFSDIGHVSCVSEDSRIYDIADSMVKKMKDLYNRTYPE